MKTGWGRMSVLTVGSFHFFIKNVTLTGVIHDKVHILQQKLDFSGLKGVSFRCFYFVSSCFSRVASKRHFVYDLVSIFLEIGSQIGSKINKHVDRKSITFFTDFLYVFRSPWGGESMQRPAINLPATR